MKPVTGQIIIRDTPITTPDGRKLKMIIGIIAVPDGVDLKTEHQYTVSNQLLDSPMVPLCIYPESETDVSKITTGQGIGCLVREPIWRY